MGLSPEKAVKRIRATPHGRVAFYDETRGEPVKPDDWKPPDFRSLVKIAQTEQGRSEVSYVLEHVQGLTMAKPMIFTDDTRPSHFALLTRSECKQMRVRKMQLTFMIFRAFSSLSTTKSQKCSETLIFIVF